MRGRIILLSGLLLGSITLSVICTIYITGNNNHGLLLSKSLHVYEEDKPSSYFTLDWVMRPMTMQNGRRIPTDNCREDENNCSPMPAQLDMSCPDINSPSSQTVTFSTAATVFGNGQTAKRAESMFSSDTTGGHGWYFDATSNQVRVTADKEWKYLEANCKLERVSRLHTVPNTPESFSLFGTHSFVILTWFIFLIFTVIASSNIFKEMKTSYFNEYITPYTYAYSLLALFLTVLAIKIFTESVITENGQDFIRNVPNSSYMYGFLYLLLFAFYTIINLKDHFEMDSFTGGGSRPSANQVMPEPAEYLVSEQDPMNSRLKNGELDLNFGAMKKLNTGALRSKTQVQDTASYVLATPTAMAQLGSWLVRKHEWTVVQFFILPLWLLAIHTSSHGTVLDIKLQAIFVAAVVYCILDLYLYNYQTLREKYRLLFPRSDKAPGLRKIVPWMSAFSVITLFQILLVIWLNFELNLSYDNMGELDSAHVRSRIDMTGIILFNVWAGLALIGKVVDSYYEVSSTRLMVFKNMDEVLQFIFITIVFLALSINLGYHYLDHNYFLNALMRSDSANLPVGMKSFMPDILELRTRWAAKMMPVSPITY